MSSHLDEARPPKARRRARTASVDLGHLSGLVGYALKRAQHAVSRNFNRRFETLGIRPSELGVLTVVARNPGLKQSDVGTALGIKRANLVPLLRGLERRGLVARGRAASDRRSHALRLTREGEAILVELMRREADHEAEIAGLISAADRRRLVRLLDRVRRACEAADLDPD